MARVGGAIYAVDFFKKLLQVISIQHDWSNGQ